MFTNSENRKFVIKDSTARELALSALFNITENKRKSNLQLKEVLGTEGLKSSDRALIERLVCGTLDYLIQIDYVIDTFSVKPSAKLKPLIRGILRLSVYQLMYMDRVPGSAVVNEAVKLAKLHGFEGLSGFVNAVLRKISGKIAESGRESLIGEKGYVRYSVPEWLWKKLSADFGDEKAAAVCASWLREETVAVHFNLSKGLSEAEILAMLEKDGIKAEKADMTGLIKANGLTEPEGRLPVVYTLGKMHGVEELEAFKKGYVFVQDPAAALTEAYAAPSHGDHIIDVCAAPGGKSLGLADMMEGTGLIEARDISPAKTALIDENIARTGFTNITTSVKDALAEDEDSFFRADIVIADLPCSGLGIVGRKPDIKYNLAPYSIRELQELQRDMLTVVSKYVKVHGRLIYSTCTITYEENENNVKWAEEALDLKLISMNRIMPSPQSCGFFIAVFEKVY